MPENTGDTAMEIIVTGSVLGEQTINRFFYVLDGAPSDTILNFLTEFGNTVLTAVLVTMSNQASFDSAIGQEVKGGNNFDAKTYSAPGSVSGDCLPPFVAWDYTLLRSGVGERNGYKRFAGVPESSQVNGNPTTGARTNLDLAAAALFGHVLNGTDEWVPVVRRTRIHHVAQVPPKYYNISNVSFSRIGSQNSRKQGHGR